ncbi:MAG: ATP-dependent DNA helicase RecG [Thomasclavelia sp.]|nr:ATP-dependent DNA helicase RecG [Thomasclavelia sp.]
MNNDLKNLKINSNRQQLLSSMGINSIHDIITYFPYRYEIIQKTELIDNEKCVVEGKVISPVKIFFKGRMSRMSFDVEVEGVVVKVTIFNRHFLKQNLTLDKIITIIGKYKLSTNTITASNIKIQPINQVQGINPVYSLKDGITQLSFKKYVQKALNYYLGHISDDIPEYLMEKYHLINRELAYHNIHLGNTPEEIKEAIKYLKYEEFFKFQLTMQYINNSRHHDTGIKKVININKLNEFIASLSFKLTKDQQEVVREIIHDLKSGKTMYRFLQGDVGSGKTIVATIGLYANYLAGYQGAFMAPTEILALQHYNNLIKVFEKSDLKIELLTGSLSIKEKNDIYERLISGKIDIVIGTHALFQDKVVFKNLGFVITDEQHRFGVEQRKSLKDKGEKVDFLVMSATPIPRTMAIALYGDMDVSTIHTLPSGRNPIISEVYYTKSMKPVLKRLTDYLDKGGQAYVVCPLVESSETLDSRDATNIYNAMSKYFQGKYKIGLLHGKMDDKEKEKVMNDFKDNKYQILVATTVIEVGVDVANANMMIIYNSERFGLSQLHQLRGRVGRSNVQGYCYFLAGSKDEDVKERLEFLKENNDGFEISMFDLKRRGPGEILGNKQSGVPTFRIGDVFKDFDILDKARKDAYEVINEENKDEVTIKLLNDIKTSLKKNNAYID